MSNISEILGNCDDITLADVRQLLAKQEDEIIANVVKRILYGVLVAKAKLELNGDEYKLLVQKNDPNGVMMLLTDINKEQEVLSRVKMKMDQYIKDIDLTIDIKDNLCSSIRDIYEKYIIPLTKDVEKDYIFNINDK